MNIAVTEEITTNAENIKNALAMFMGHDLRWWRYWSNVSMVFGLVVGAIGAVVVIGATVVVLKLDSAIEEYDARQYRSEKLASEKQIAASNATAELGRAEAAKANEGLADANSKIAEANARAQEAKLETERLRQRLAPRFPGPAFTGALSGKPTASADIVYLKDTPDTFEYSGWIVSRLAMAGWRIVDLRPIELDTSDPVLRLLPLPISAKGQPTGISLVANFAVPGVGIAQFNGPIPAPILETIAKTSPSMGALAKAFSDNGDNISINVDEKLKDGVFRIVVAPK